MKQSNFNQKIKDINEFEIERALANLAKDLQRLDAEQVKDLLSKSS
ncbi:MAG: hypothetical protein IBX57_07880 [Gammaproteobacteria bacterium]|nr:hypothetical protein [Gammaproteobacteria bacterium]